MTIFNYVKRSLEVQIQELIQAFPVIVLTGPRQSGKSTLLKQLLGDDYQYVTFDDYKMVDFFSQDPELFFQAYGHKVIFDEVQKVPQIFSHIKMCVDKDRHSYGKFILTGSSQFKMMQSVSESLAGRVALLSLLPFDYTELNFELNKQVPYRGSYPELVLRNYLYHQKWYASYLETYLEKDLRLIYKLGDLRDFRRLIQLLAANVSGILNMSRLSVDLGVSVSTVKRWISILEMSYIIFLLPAYTKSLGKRVIKSPKIYFYDNGLVAYLTGIDSLTLYEKGPMRGALFENYIVSEIKKISKHQQMSLNMFFYRTSHGEEVDLILESSKGRVLIEIKSRGTFKTAMINPMRKILKDDDKAYLIYQGETLPPMGNISVFHYENFLSLFANSQVFPLLQ